VRVARLPGGRDQRHRDRRPARPPAKDAPPEEVERAGRLLGEGLASVSNLLDLSLVAVGGSVALGFGAPFFAAANTALHDVSRLGFTRDCRVVPVGLGAQGPLVGAAALAWRALGRDVGAR
jgi:glucokinase